MKFLAFADAMARIGFQDDDPVTPRFMLTRRDLAHPVFRNAYTKTAGAFRIVSIWAEGDDVAFWAQRDGEDGKLYPFHKDEVGYLAARKKFKK